MCKSKLMYRSRSPCPIQTDEPARHWRTALDDRLRSASHNSPLANACGGMIGGVLKNGCRQNGSFTPFIGQLAVPLTSHGFFRKRQRGGPAVSSGRSLPVYGGGEQVRRPVCERERSAASRAMHPVRQDRYATPADCRPTSHGRYRGRSIPLTRRFPLDPERHGA